MEQGLHFDEHTGSGQDDAERQETVDVGLLLTYCKPFVIAHANPVTTL
jgi:hypothetical protein